MNPKRMFVMLVADEEVDSTVGAMVGKFPGT